MSPRAVSALEGESDYRPYEEPILLELGELSELTSYSVSVRAQ